MNCKPNLNSLIHQIIALSKSLGVEIPLPVLESTSLDLYYAMENKRRNFHTLEHLAQFTPEDPIEELAVLYHDVVYWNVDGCWPRTYEDFLQSVSPQGGGAEAGLPGLEKLAEEQGLTDLFHDVLILFDRDPQKPVQAPGANELFSALTLVHVWGQWLDRQSILGAVACIEATIPFRKISVGEQLFQRLLSVGIEQGEARIMVRRALHMANQDVGDFQLDDPGLFLSGTWNLLPELNPDLQIAEHYTCRTYCQALGGILGFLGSLQAEQIFHDWNGYPEKVVFEGMLDRARNNLVIAKGYLEAKLVTAIILEAIALESGGDGPLALFMGSVSPCGTQTTLDELLPPVQEFHISEKDPVYHLLSQGRTRSTQFDLKNSPLASWLYARLGTEKCQTILANGQRWRKGEMDNLNFLATIPPDVLMPLVVAIRDFVPTRAKELERIGPQN